MKNFFAAMAAVSLLTSFAVPQTVRAGANLDVVFENTPLFNEANFLPGDAVTRWVKVMNKTPSNQVITVKLKNYSDPDSLGDRFDVVVKEHGALTNLYSGTMTGLAALSELVLDSALVPNVQKQFDFSVTFQPDSDNTNQKRSLSFDLDIQIQGQNGDRVTISGMKFNDQNGNHAKDGQESGLPGWQIIAISNDPAASVSVDSRSTAGSDTGSLPIGTYLIKVSGAWTNRNNPAELFDAEYYTLDSWSNHADGTTGYSGAGPDEGDLMVGTNFVNWGPYNSAHEYYLLYNHAATGPINFSVFDGDTTTGVKNPNWYDDNNGSLSVQVFSVYDTAITDNSGNYQLSVPDNVATVQLFEIQQNGWLQTYPASGHYTVDLDSEGLDNFDFGNKAIGDNGCLTDCGGGGEGGISGKVFNDSNNNGILDAGEAGLEGWVVYLDSNDNGVLDDSEPSTNTDTGGNYAFMGLSAGNYVVRQVGKSGWTQTLPTSDGGKYLVLVGTTVVGDKNFGNFTPSGGGCTSSCGGGGGGGGGTFISGQKFNDLNRNGQKDLDEPGLPGWTIYFDLNGNNALDNGEPFTVTDAQGNYTFSAVTSGLTRVREVQQFGWTQTFPGQAHDFEHTINVINGGNYAGMDFGNGQGQVAGISVPGVNLPQIAGAITTLPKTGLPPEAWLYLAILSMASGATLIRKRNY